MMTVRTAFSITMSDMNRIGDFLLLGGYDSDTGRYRYNCVSEYSLKGGPESPFETLVLVVPRQRLRYVAPDLENKIIPGRNRVTLNAIGFGDFTVVKCKYSGRKFKITCYCGAERFRGSTLGIAGERTAPDWINYILDDAATYDVTLRGRVIRSEYVPGTRDTIAFEKGTNIWYILQVCATIMRCKIWFADNMAYVVDQTLAANSTGVGTLDLYTSADVSISQRVIGDVTLGDEGMDSVVNSIKLRYKRVTAGEGDKDDTSALTTDTWYEADSKATYGEYSGGQLNVVELKSGTMKKSEEDLKKIEEELEDPDITDARKEELEKQKNTPDTISLAETFANNYMAYRAEPQQTVTFEIKEIEGSDTGQNWVAFFDQTTRAEAITDSVDEFEVNNSTTTSDSGAPKYQKLLMSQYERHYPDGTTEYTFGLISNIDLSSSTSQILTALNNN